MKKEDHGLGGGQSCGGKKFWGVVSALCFYLALTTTFSGMAGVLRKVVQHPLSLFSFSM